MQSVMARGCALMARSRTKTGAQVNQMVELERTAWPCMQQQLTTLTMPAAPLLIAFANPARLGQNPSETSAPAAPLESSPILPSLLRAKTARLEKYRM